jgi:hypothetical protein
VSSEIVGPLERRRKRERVRRTSRARRSGREFAIEFLGPLTILGGVVWGIFQPYRIAFLDPQGKGFYDYLVQPPLLVVAVGLIFTFLIAPGLIEDLRRSDGAES